MHIIIYEAPAFGTRVDGYFIEENIWNSNKRWRILL